MFILSNMVPFILKLMIQQAGDASGLCSFLVIDTSLPRRCPRGSQSDPPLAPPPAPPSHPNMVNSGTKKNKHSQKVKVKASKRQSTNQWVTSQWLRPLRSQFYFNYYQNWPKNRIVVTTLFYKFSPLLFITSLYQSNDFFL